MSGLLRDEETENFLRRRYPYAVEVNFFFEKGGYPGLRVENLVDFSMRLVYQNVYSQGNFSF